MTGIFGVYLSKNESMNDYLSLRSTCGLDDIKDIGTLITMIGLFNLQHRGQLSAKIIDAKGKVIEGKGLVVDILKNKNCVVNNSRICMGSVNNYFNGEEGLEESYSSFIDKKQISFVHDGHPVFQNVLNNLEGKNLNEEILNLIKNFKKKNIVSRIKNALSKIKGSYSWIFAYDDKIIAIRQGATPLYLGVLKRNSYIFASESCAFRDMDVKEIKNIKPGDGIVVTKDGLIKFRLNNYTGGCVFELVYRGRPDSFIFGENVAQFRINSGKELGKTEKVDADIVVPVPEAGIFSATGFSQQTKIPLIFALIRDYNMGRYFFEPNQIKRNALIKRKLKVIKELVYNKKVIVVDEAIITGTTLKLVTDVLRKNGAKEIHIRIPSPVHKSPCDKGVLSPGKDLLFDKLIKDSKRKNDNAYIENAFRNYFKVDSLKFLDKDRFLNILNKNTLICTKCINK